MNWAQWTKTIGVRIPAGDLTPGNEVMFRRGNTPQRGKIVDGATELRVPLLRINADGTPASRRLYWRNRTQLYRT